MQDAANLVVLDDFFGESELKDFTQVLCGTADCPSAGPSEDRWERNTADDAHGSKTWGLQANYLQQLAQNPTPGMIEIQSRLVSILLCQYMRKTRPWLCMISSAGLALEQLVARHDLSESWSSQDLRTANPVPVIRLAYVYFWLWTGHVF